MTTRKYRTIGDIEEEYLRKHREEIGDYITILFDEYAEHNDMAILLSSMRVICRVLGISYIAQDAGISRKGLQNALSDNGNPQFSSINAIVSAMGYRITVQPKIHAEN